MKIDNLDFIPDNLLMQFFYEGQERSLLMITVARLDDYLLRILQTQLRTIKKPDSHYLFRMGGPLQSVYSKNVLIYEMKMIDKDLFDVNSNLIKMRNKSAHELKYDQNSIIDIFKNIEKKLQNNRVYKLIKETQIEAERPLFYMTFLNFYLIMIYELYLKELNESKKKLQLKLNPLVFQNITNDELIKFKEKIFNVNLLAFQELIKDRKKE